MAYNFPYFTELMLLLFVIVLCKAPFILIVCHHFPFVLRKYIPLII